MAGAGVAGRCWGTSQGRGSEAGVAVGQQGAHVLPPTLPEMTSGCEYALTLTHSQHTFTEYLLCPRPWQDTGMEKEVRRFQEIGTNN